MIVSQIMKNNPKHFDNVAIIHAKYNTLINFNLREYRFDCQMNLNNCYGNISTEYFSQRIEMYPQMIPMIYIFKYLLKENKINVYYKGGFSSFLLYCLLIHFFNLKSQVFENMEVENSIFEDIINFLEYYCRYFDSDTKEMVFHDGGSFLRNKLMEDSSLKIFNLNPKSWTCHNRSFDFDKLKKLFSRK